MSTMRDGLAFGLLIASTVALVLPGAASAGSDIWTTTGPAVADIDAVVTDPRTRDVAYAITRDAVLFKTTTGGASWTPINAGLRARVHSIAIDPKTPATVYAGTDEGVSKSTNGGAGWAASSAGLTGGFVFALVVDPLTPTTLYAGNFGGVFKSTNGGASWFARSVGLGGAAITALVVDPLTPTTLYAVATSGRLFKTTTGANGWAAINNPQPFVVLPGTEVVGPVEVVPVEPGGDLGLPEVLALAIDPKTPTTLYAGTVGGVFKSTDGGATWSSRNTGLGSRFIHALAVDPQTPTTIYASDVKAVLLAFEIPTADTATADLGPTGRVFRTTDGAASWTDRSSGITAPVGALAIDSQAPANVYAASSGGGVFKSADRGDGWGARNAGLSGVTIFALAVDPHAPTTIYAGTVSAGVFKSTNGGLDWNASNAGMTNVGVIALAIDPVAAAILYASGRPFATSRSTVFKTTNGGGFWTLAEAGLPQSSVRALAIDPGTPTVLYAGTERDGVFKSTDAGGAWSARNVGLANLNVRALAVDPAAPSTVYAGTLGGVFKSTDSGATWSERNTGLTALSVDALLIDQRPPAPILYAVAGRKVQRSLNGGASWLPASTTGLADHGVNALAIDGNAPGAVYAGTTGGVFRSPDSGLVWSELNRGLANRLKQLNVFAIATTPSGACLHAGTFGGVFDFATEPSAECPPPPVLAASLSRRSDSVAIGGTATVLATIENVSAAPVADQLDGALLPSLGLACGVTQITGAPTPFTYQAVDPSGQPTAPVNTPVDIPSGSSQTLVLTLTPTAPLCALDIQFGFDCANTEPAPIITGFNTLLLSAGAPGSCGVSASVTISQPTFAVGQNLIAGGSVTNAGLAGVAADFYVGVVRPDNSVQFFTATGVEFGDAANLASFRPLAVGVPLDGSFSVSQPSIFTQQWTESDSRGSYTFFLIAVKAGSLAAGTLTGDQVLGLATAPYAFP